VTLLQLAASALGSRRAVKLGGLAGQALHLLKYGDPWFPQQVFLEVGAECNRACGYCPNSSHPQAPAEMSADVFLAALYSLRALKYRGLVAYHFFNEPTLRSDLAGLVAATKSLVPWCHPVLFTNGDKLDLALASALVRAGLERCTVSRHRPYSDEWDARVEGVRATHPRVFKVAGLDPAGLSSIGGHSRSRKAQVRRCMAQTRALLVAHNGDVLLCCCDYRRQHVFGNVLRQTISEVWAGGLSAAARQLRSGVRPYPVCRACTGVE